MRIVSFGTPGPYEAELAELKRSAAKFDLEVHGEIVTGLKDWHEAVCSKPAFVLRQLTRLEEWEQLLWLDADARIVGRPDFAPFSDALFAAHRHRWSASHPWEMLTGTLLFRCTVDVLDLVMRWAHLTKEWAKVNRDTPEQHSLAEAYGNLGSRVMCRELGPELCWIDSPEFTLLHPGKKPVIFHLQRSRLYKR